MKGVVLYLRLSQLLLKIMREVLWKMEIDSDARDGRGRSIGQNVVKENLQYEGKIENPSI